VSPARTVRPPLGFGALLASPRPRQATAADVIGGCRLFYVQITVA